MSNSVGISENDFKLGMRELAAAVNIITTTYKGKKEGLTATAACAVSAEPPQLLVCVNSEARGHDLIKITKKFALNILRRDQENIANRFAGMDGADRTERFNLGSWSEITTGAPCLDGAIVNFDCEVIQQISAGTHSIFIGHIIGCRNENSGASPLMYSKGEFTGLVNHESR
ncbi:MAG: flavin reductase family protein [Pseudomonadota bacterium]|nr:flavin reductase family protein [Pseudomonadota bacterium]